MKTLSQLPRPFFVLAPMDDVTDTVFRQIITSCAKPDLLVTEFVNVDGLQSPGREKLLPRLKFIKKEQPIFVQAARNAAEAMQVRRNRESFETLATSIGESGVNKLINRLGYNMDGSKHEPRKS